MNSLLLFIVSNLVVSSLIACLAFVVGRLGRYAVVAHLLWIAVFIKLVTPPIVLAPIAVPYQWTQPLRMLVAPTVGVDLITSAAVQNPDKASSVALTSISVAQQGEVNSSIAASIQNLDLMHWLFAVWAGGTSLLIWRGALRFVRFTRLLKREGVVDSEATQMVRHLLRDKFATHSTGDVFVPSVVRISACVSPMLFGIGKGTSIVCPNRLWNSLSEVERRAFLAHEVAHYLRRDHWVRWVEWSVTAIYWWFPLVYVARRELERHEEAACDAWAIGRLGAAPRSYAETLLSVVDFLSDSNVGSPRLASRMQPTDSLEERLRLIMSPVGPARIPKPVACLLTVICLSLLILHPLPYAAARSVSVPQRVIADQRQTLDNDGVSISGVAGDSASLDTQSLVSLPPVPRGWWNDVPNRTWANHRLSGQELRLLAEAGSGISVQKSDRLIHRFDNDAVRAMACVQSSGRLILGNAAGELHLWDVDSAMPVSLIGRHKSAVTSLAFHPTGGLVSGDAEGNLYVWDIQSGQILETASISGPICSVRWSRSGEQIAVLLGDWSLTTKSMQLQLLNSPALQRVQTIALPHNIAIAQQHERLGWVAVDWSGIVSSLVTGETVGSILKSDVSGIALCQDLFVHFDQEVSNE